MSIVTDTHAGPMCRSAFQARCGSGILPRLAASTSPTANRAWKALLQGVLCRPRLSVPGPLRHFTAAFGFVIALSAAASAAPFSHAAWDELLARHVVEIRDGASTEVDYAGFADDRAELGAYLDALSDIERTEFDAWPIADQLAFLINAYNAWTVELILTEYPDIDSIRDLGSLFSSPWKKKIAPLLGETLTLDDIEHGLIRGSGRYDEPRIHFAVNCASIGCPALATDAYRGDAINDQLEAATVAFLGDRTRNRLAGDDLEVSSIFKWYRDDFASGWRGAESLGEFLILYADALDLDTDAVEALRGGTIDIGFLPYDWALNDRR